jgi:P27 family predicted phage terminase small subunit
MRAATGAARQSMGRRAKPLAALEESGALKHDPARYAERVENEPKPELNGAKKPAGLTPLAEKHWQTFHDLVHGMRVLAETDAFALGMLAEAYAEWREATDRINKDKSRLPSARRDLDSAFNRFLKIQQEFGMTPAARAKVRVVSKAPTKNRYSNMRSKRGQAYEEPK